MPKSLCRMAGRSPNRRALRISSLGKVSASSGGVDSPRHPPNSPRPSWQPPGPSLPFTGRSLSSHKKMASRQGQVSTWCTADAHFLIFFSSHDVKQPKANSSQRSACPLNLARGRRVSLFSFLPKRGAERREGANLSRLRSATKPRC